GSGFAGQYHVEVAFRADSGTTRQFATDETVRVRTLQKTVRANESVIYQQFIAVRPGIYHIDVTVRDRNAPAVAHGQRADTVPRLAGQGMSEPLAVYQGPGRTRLADVPKLLANPRGAVSYGADSLRFYVETYGMPRGARLAAHALDQAGHEVWHDTVALSGTDSFASALVVLRPGDLPVGQGRFEVSTVGAAAAGGGAARSTPFLVSFSDQWAITNYDQMISLLRHVQRQEWVDKLRLARHPLDLLRAAADTLLPGSERLWPLPPDTPVTGRIPARRGAGTSPPVRRAGVLARCGAAAALLVVSRAAVSQTSPDLAAQHAESLRLSGRPWHAAEALLAAAAREPRLNATFIVEGAKAELHARRYDRA